MTAITFEDEAGRREAAEAAASSGRGPASPPRTLLDVFNATLLRCEGRIALEAVDATLSYRELSDAAGVLATRLRALAIGPGDRVGVRVPSGTADLYVAILGVLCAGAAYVPVDADDPPARAEELWKGSGPCAVIGEGLTISELLEPSRGGERELTPQDEAWVIFTSGSTGVPKGVAVTHRSAAAFIDAEAALWSIGVDDRVLAGLSVGSTPAARRSGRHGAMARRSSPRRARWCGRDPSSRRGWPSGG